MVAENEYETALLRHTLMNATFRAAARKEIASAILSINESMRSLAEVGIMLLNAKGSSAEIDTVTSWLQSSEREIADLSTLMISMPRPATMTK